MVSAKLVLTGTLFSACALAECPLRAEFENNIILKAFQNSLSSQLLNVDALQTQMQGKDGNAKAGVFLSAASDNINHALGMVSTATSALPNPFSRFSANILLTPFVQSITTGAEMALSNMDDQGGDNSKAVDLAVSLSKLASKASSAGIDVTRLSNTATKFHNMALSGNGSNLKARQVPDFDQSKAALNNCQGVQEEINSNMNEDAQSFVTATIENINNISKAIDEFSTSKDNYAIAFGYQSLSPLITSISDGMEQILTNGNSNQVSNEDIQQLSQSLEDLSSKAEKFNINVNHLNKIISQIQG